MNINHTLAEDIERVNQIPIVPAILDVICQTTGMRFAAVARVTQDRWIACSVRDEIQFGLIPGGELKLETTICNEIRQSHKPVIIDNVALDHHFCNHHTPKMYGFQSYISIPIILKHGEFFGTLCAIDPQPAQLNNSKTIQMFNLFAELIAFHLQSMDLMQQSDLVLRDLKQQLIHSKDENRQYQYISNHNLQEPLRKIRIFSNFLVSASDSGDMEKTKEYAMKINLSAQRFSMMIKDISEFSSLSYGDLSFEWVDLNKIIADVCSQLLPALEEKNGTIHIGTLPSIYGIPLHIEQLFFHLISNAIKFSKKNVPPHIKISYKEAEQDKVKHRMPAAHQLKYYEVCVEDNGVGIEKSELEKIFDIFSISNYEPSLEGFGIGLAYCRKIVRIHKGTITAQSEVGKGTGFSIIFPTNND